MKELFQQFKKYQYLAIPAIIVIVALFTISQRFISRTGQGSANPTATPNLATPTASVVITSPTNSPVPASQSAATPPVPTPASSPSSTTNQDNRLISSMLGSPSHDANSQAFYFIDPTDSFVKRFQPTNQELEIINGPVSFARQASWSPNHQRLVVFMTNEEIDELPNPLYREELPYRSRIVAMYDVAAHQFHRLNDNITAIAFLGNDRIIYQFQDGRFNNLSIAQANGADWKNIMSPKGDLEIVAHGETALVQEIGKTEVTRYDQSGKILEKMSVPKDFQLRYSRWAGRNRNTIYWTATDDGNKSTVKRLRPTGEPETLTTLSIKPYEMTILWDNKEGRLYLSSLDGLEELSVTSKP